MIAGLFFGFIPIVAGVTNLLTLESISKAGLEGGGGQGQNIGGFIIRVAFWVILYFTYKQKPKG